MGCLQSTPNGRVTPSIPFSGGHDCGCGHGNTNIPIEENEQSSCKTCGAKLVGLDGTIDIEDAKPNEIYVLPDGKVYILNFDGTKFIKLNSTEVEEMDTIY